MFPVMRWLFLLILGGSLIVLIAEHRRRRSVEARIRAILSSSLTGLAILDRNGIVEDCNDKWMGPCETRNPFTTAKRGIPRRLDRRRQRPAWRGTLYGNSPAMTGRPRRSRRHEATFVFFVLRSDSHPLGGD
jgi:hypothetical protein